MGYAPYAGTSEGGYLKRSVSRPVYQPDMCTKHGLQDYIVDHKNLGKGNFLNGWIWSSWYCENLLTLDNFLR